MTLKLGSFQGRRTESFEFADELDKDGELEVCVSGDTETLRYLSRVDMLRLVAHLLDVLDGV